MAGLAAQVTRLCSGAEAPVAELRRLTSDILVAAGMAVERARIAAEVLTDAQLSGVDSHGLTHLPMYVRRLVDGSIDGNAVMTISRTGPSAAIMDAANGLGVLAACQAMSEAIRLALETGIGGCAVRNSSHFGAASYFVRMAADRGMIGLAFSNAAPTMAPPGGREPILGTNPIAVAFSRANAAPIVIDMATSAVARGRIRKAAAEKSRIPLDWALDRQGNPTDDPEAALAGTVQPMAGAKGYALALAVELLCVALSGGRPGYLVRNPHDTEPKATGTSHFFMAIDPDHFSGGATALAVVEAIAERVETCDQSGADGPRLPGRRAADTRDHRSVHGISLTPELLKSLMVAATLADCRSAASEQGTNAT